MLEPGEAVVLEPDLELEAGTKPAVPLFGLAVSPLAGRARVLLLVGIAGDFRAVGEVGASSL